jgi:hypothetical protein
VVFLAAIHRLPPAKKPAMDIAGLCLPLKPQKERGDIWVFNDLHAKKAQRDRLTKNKIQKEYVIRTALTGYGRRQIKIKAGNVTNHQIAKKLIKVLLTSFKNMGVNS